MIALQRYQFSLTHTSILRPTIIFLEFCHWIRTLRITYICTQSESNISISLPRQTAETVGYTAVCRIRTPSSTAMDSTNPTHRSGRIELPIIVIRSIPVRTPLGNISIHVVDTQFIWRFPSHFMGHSTAVHTIPRDIAGRASFRTEPRSR